MVPYFWHTFKMTFKNNFTKMFLCLKVRNVTIFLILLETGMKSTTYRSVLKIRYQKNSKNMKRSRSTYQPRESCPALRNRCPRKLKNSSNTSEPSRSTSSRNGRFSGARTCSVNVTYTVISHQPRVSKLAESGARHDLSIFWFVWQKSARPQNNAIL